MALKAYSTPSYWQRVKIALHYLLPQLAITRAAGWLAERRWGSVTHFIIKAFAKQYQVNLTEAEKSSPSDYATFNEFFIRPLKAGARPIEVAPDYLCLPADGRVSESGKIDANRLIQAKGHFFTLETLLAEDAEMAAKFQDGDFITTYLSPSDYHRVHMPCDATLRKMVYVPGELFSVNTEGEGVIRLSKGEEMGAFRLGSTVINLFPKGAVALEPHLQAGEKTRMGEKLGRLLK